MEFNMAWYMKYQVNNDMDFRELSWLYEKLIEKVNNENENDTMMANKMKSMFKG